MGFVANHPLAAAGIAGSAGVGMATGVSTFRQDQEDIGDRFTRAGLAGTRAVLATGVAGAIGYGLYKNRSMFSTVGRKAGSFLRRQQDKAMFQLAGDKYMLGAMVPTSEAHAAHMAALGVEGISSTRAAVEPYLRNSRLLAAGGAGAGLLIGASMGHPIAGMAAGAGLGLALKGGVNAAGAWKRAGKFPGLRTASMLALSTMLFAGVSAATPAQYQSESYAVSDGNGGYDISNQAPLRDRMRTMGASGNLVLGLNRGRHG